MKNILYILIIPLILQVKIVYGQPAAPEPVPLPAEPVKTQEQLTKEEAERNDYFNSINKNLYFEKYDAVQSLLDEYKTKYPDSDDRRFYYYSGLLNEYKEQFSGAIKNYSKAIYLFPGYSKARERLGAIFLDTGRYSDSESQLLLASELNPYNPGIKYYLGLLYLKKQKYKKARKYLEKACEYKKNYGIAFNALGIALYNLKEHLAAIDNFNNAVKFHSASHETFYFLGKCFSEIGQGTKSLQLFKKAVEIDGNYVDCLLELGRISFLEKDYKSAIKYFLKAETRDFDNRKIRIAIAECYYNLKRYDDAMDIIENVTGKRPGKKELAKALKKLRKNNIIYS